MSNHRPGRTDQVECVGSLLVHTSDVQELSDRAVHPELPDVNLQKCVTVGTLLVNRNDLDSSRSGDDHHNATVEEEKDANNSSPSIVRRITKALQGPAPDDAEADTWAD